MIKNIVSWEVTDMIKDVFDEDELNDFFNYVDKSNDKERDESIKHNMKILLSK